MKSAASPAINRGLIAVVLAVLTVVAYGPVVRNGFINLDDARYVTANAQVQSGLNWTTVKWAFSTFDASNWHPLTWLSHALDCQLYGLNPAGHHLTGLILHLGNVLLLFYLLERITGQCWPAGFAALLFAIHPMHVESVAWVAERKDQLSAGLLFLTLLAYCRYAKDRKAGRAGGWFYVLALFFFALGLLAKPMLVTAPALMILLDYWPLNRVVWLLKVQPPDVFRNGLVEKVPFVLLAAASSVVTVAAQNQGGAVKELSDFPLADRLPHAVVACAWYVEKLFWPANLSAYYQLRRQEPIGQVAGAAVLLLTISVLAVNQARRRPFLLAGWLWFLVMLVPVIGLVQVGNQAFADRYTYLPYVGLAIMVAWGAQALLTRWPRWRPLVCLGAIVVSGSWVWLTRIQVHYWKSAQTLFAQAVAVDGRNEEAWILLGLEYMMNQNNPDQGLDCLQRAVAINPRSFFAWNALSRAQAMKGDYAAAESSLRTAIAEAPDRSDQYVVLADLLAKTGRYSEAIACLQSPKAPAPGLPGIHSRLGAFYNLARMPDKAMPELQQAVTLDPDDAQAEFNLAEVCDQTGHPAEAAAHYRRTVALEPDNTVAANNLAWWLATAPDPAQRNGAEAVRLAEHACAVTGNGEPFLIGTLAAAYAEAGRFNEAVTTASRARELALAKGQNDVAANNERLLKFYSAGRAFHQDSQPAP